MRWPIARPRAVRAPPCIPSGWLVVAVLLAGVGVAQPLRHLSSAGAGRADAPSTATTSLQQWPLSRHSFQITPASSARCGQTATCCTTAQHTATTSLSLISSVAHDDTRMPRFISHASPIISSGQPGGTAAWAPRLPQHAHEWRYPDLDARLPVPGALGPGVPTQRFWDRAALQRGLKHTNLDALRPVVEKLHRGEPITVTAVGSSIFASFGG